MTQINIGIYKLNQAIAISYITIYYPADDNIKKPIEDLYISLQIHLTFYKMNNLLVIGIKSGID
jgi:hypothetical protein